MHRGDVIADIDPKDVEVKVAQAQGDLETALAQAADADARVAITRATAQGALVSAQGGLQSSHENVDTSQAAIREAQAGINRAAANAEKAKRDWERASELGAKGDISKSQVDAARAANEAAQADLALAHARLNESQNAAQAAQANVQKAQGRLVQSEPVAAQVTAAEAQARLAHAKVQTQQAVLQAAQLTLSYTKIIAPADGIASKLAVHPGSLVNIGQPIVQIVPQHTYVIANFKETQVRQMRPGQRGECESRRARQPGVRRQGREPLRRHGRELLAAAARQRVRQLREGRAAGAGAHLVERPAERSRAGRLIGRSDGLHEVDSRWQSRVEGGLLEGDVSGNVKPAITRRSRSPEPGIHTSAPAGHARPRLLASRSREAAGAIGQDDPRSVDCMRPPVSANRAIDQRTPLRRSRRRRPWLPGTDRPDHAPLPRVAHSPEQPRTR